MIKVLLVDDEKVVREDLQTLIEWEENGFRLLEAASNGRQALQIFKRDKPQIVISDIRMPLCDGLQLAQAIRNINPNTAIILLTAYKDLDYAISAVNIGVTRYLLKSSLDSKTLLDELGAVKKQIVSARPVDDQELRRLLCLLIRPAILEEDYYRAIHLLHLPDRDAEYCLLKARIDAYVGRTPTGFDARDDRLHRTFESCVSEVLADKRRHVVSEMGLDDFVIVLCGMVHLNAKAGMLEIVSLCRDIQRLFQLRSGETVSFGVSNMSYSLRNLPHHFQDAEVRLQLAYVEGDNAVIDSSLADRLGTAREAPTAKSLLSEIRSLIKERRFEKCEQMLGVLFDAVRHAKEAISIATELEDLLSTQAIRMGIPKKEVYRLDESPTAVFARMRNSRQFTLFFAEAVARLEVCSGTRKAETACHKAEEAIAFIAEKFARPIRLSDIADALHLTKEYTSKMFKRAIGENLFSFLRRYRIEEARKELLTSNKQVQQIAEEVGFVNLQHFSAAFKKQIGCAPTEFRNKNLMAASPSAGRTGN